MNVNLMIVERIKRLKEELEELKSRNGIEDDIKLIAVSKYVGEEEILEAIGCGQYIFGESRIKESTAKIRNLGFKYKGELEWHLIGHLQTNKVRDAVKSFSYIHSIDSLHTAEALSKECKKQGKEIKVFIQVNTTGERSKFGIGEDGVNKLLEGVLKLSNLLVVGLMTISVLTKEEKVLRKSFKKLRELRDELELRFGGDGASCKYLSMGMSNDYKIAIEEGSTHIRVGSYIFGGYK